MAVAHAALGPPSWVDSCSSSCHLFGVAAAPRVRDPLCAIRCARNGGVAPADKTMARTNQPFSPPWTVASNCARCGPAGMRDVLHAVAQAPDVLLLIFNVLVSALMVISRGVWICVTGAPAFDRKAYPDILRPGYQYPSYVAWMWVAAGALLGGWAASAIGDRSWFAIYVLPCALTGSWVAFRRLIGWRQWLHDAKAEEFRVRELSALDDAMATLKLHEARVLDFGAGTGLVTAHMIQKKGMVSSVNAIDLEAHPPHVAAYDGVTIPFEPGTFDFATSFYVFHHVPSSSTGGEPSHQLALLRQLSQRAKHVLLFEDLVDETSKPLLSQIFFGCHFWLFGQKFHTHYEHTRAGWRQVLALGGFRIIEEIHIPPSALIPYNRVGFLCESR